MTAVSKASRPCSFVVDYDCERRCQAEVDLSGIHIRFTLGQMVEKADRAHVDAHLARQTHYRVGDEVVVRASVLEAVS
jgi:hypothetical protein